MSYLDLRDNQHSKFIHHLSDLVDILQKPFTQRSTHQNTLIAASLEKIPFFAQYAQSSNNPRDLLAELSPALNCEYYPAKSVIYHHGDLAKKFIIILKGEARRYVPRDAQDIQNELDDLNNPNRNPNNQVSKPGGESNEKKLGVAASQAFSRSPRKHVTLTFKDAILQNYPPEPISRSPQNIGNREYSVEDESRNYYQSTPAEVEFFMSLEMPKKYFVGTAISFKKGRGALVGDYFGEHGLAVNAVNDCTLVAWEDTYVAIIDKRDYEQIFQEIIEEAKEKLDFLMQNLLPGLPNKVYKIAVPFALSFQKVVYRAGDRIFHQGGNVKGFWVIKEGDIEVYRTIQYQKNEKNSIEDSPSRKKPYRALIVRLSNGQLLGEEMLVGAKERVFNAVGKSARNVVYYFDEKALEQIEPMDQIIGYLTPQARISMEGKMQRLNSAFLEAQIVLSQNENSPKMENKAKDTIDDLIQGGKIDHHDITKERSPLNSKKAKNIQDEQEAEEWKYIEKLAEVKQKVLMDKAKLDPKLITDKKVEEDLIKKGYQEHPNRANEMQIIEKRFYFPQSLYQKAVYSNKDVLRRREIMQFHLMKDRSGKPSQMHSASPTSPIKGIELNFSLVAAEKKSSNPSIIVSSPVLASGNKRGYEKSYTLSPEGRLNNTQLRALYMSKEINKKYLNRIQSNELSPNSHTTSISQDMTSPLKNPSSMSKNATLRSDRKSPTSSFQSLSQLKAKKKANEVNLVRSADHKSSIIQNMIEVEEETEPKQEVEGPHISGLKNSLRSYLSFAFGNDKQSAEREVSQIIKQSMLKKEAEQKSKAIYGFGQLGKKEKKKTALVTGLTPALSEFYEEMKIKGSNMQILAL